MSADGFRQAVLRTEEIQGASLAVVLCEDRRTGAYVRGQDVVDARHLGGHFFPSELVGIQLGQRAELVGLNARLLKMQGHRVPNVGGGRQHRNRHRRDHRASRSPCQ